MQQNFEKIEIDISDWYAVCDIENTVQAIFPAENYAFWYLERHGWGGWKIRQISAAAKKNLFFLEQENCGTENDEN